MKDVLKAIVVIGFGVFVFFAIKGSFGNGTQMVEHGIKFQNAGVELNNNNYEKALKLYKQIVIANEDNPENADRIASQYIIGIMYAKGLGTKQDYIKASKWLEMSAYQGHKESQKDLGQFYYEGKGVKQDYKEAFRLLKLSAEQGYSDAQSELGRFYYEGKGAEKDYKKAFKWFKLSAEQGNEVGQFNVGIIYEFGFGRRQNNKIAKEWYGKSCDGGYERGCQGYARLNKKI
ncbi:tetratricopeptide repeat protein [Poseidonibacter ostreae]|uniref:beta-lactamase n=1 Tax=Poseidonibacter ostreae TaxID=2654171 RepID=A0A6L4WWK7_9BACT|nr:tetratricopeptide repeat protein [Poseidonibacter ostreae]KAB7891432.1 sel1 repeat family protein [Poseidonibacter ostreae]